VKTPQAFVDAIWNYSRSYAPDLYEQVLAEKEAGS